MPMPDYAARYVLPLIGGGIGIVPPPVAHVNQEIAMRYQVLRPFRCRHGPNTGDVLSGTSGAVFNTTDDPRR